MGIIAQVLGKFHGGVHPAEHKNLSEQCAISTMPMPDELYVPLHQHIGSPCDPCVEAGSKVLKGQLIGRAAGFVSAPVHAPTSGTITEFREYVVGHPSGLTMLCAILKPDGKDTWSKDLVGLDDPLKADPADIRAKVRDCGIVGMGGATFPSFIKMSPPNKAVVELLLINGVECEPYLTCDARLMEERADDIVEGIRIMLNGLQTKLCAIGIENNKPKAIEVMEQAVKAYPEISVISLPVMYPQGGEKQLIEVVTGRQVPSGGLPINVGVIVHNVATAVAVRDAVADGKPPVSRSVTVTGLGINKPANLEVLNGTPVQALIDQCGGLKPNVDRVVMGGPMMGVALKSLDVPCVKGTSGILALTPAEAHTASEQACIRCGSCLSACPINLMPTEMSWLARHDQFDTLGDYNLFDCIECGSCSYVCPSNIPLVHYFRYGKMAIQNKAAEKKRGELSKAATERKAARVEQEKLAREQRKAEMKAKMAAK
ncbi:MAG: electron transport complex subunit RsxC, partial [Magnetococcales bacterium]|nr:electron transport complex subunit RsxC [Magnetococcales bacterium]